MTPSSTLIVTGFDANHFDLAHDMANSYRHAYQDRHPLAAIVYGAQPPPAELAALFDQVRHITGDGAAFGVRSWLNHGVRLAGRHDPSRQSHGATASASTWSHPPN